MADLYSEDELTLLKAGHKRLKSGNQMAIAIVPVKDGEPEVFVLIRKVKRFPKAARLKAAAMKLKKELARSGGPTLVPQRGIYGYASFDAKLEVDVRLGDPTKIPQVAKKLKVFAKTYHLSSFLKPVTFTSEAGNVVDDADETGSVPDLSGWDEEVDESALKALEAEETEAIDALLQELASQDLETADEVWLKDAVGEDFLSGLLLLDVAVDDVTLQLETLKTKLRTDPTCTGNEALQALVAEPATDFMALNQASAVARINTRLAGLSESKTPVEVLTTVADELKKLADQVGSDPAITEVEKHRFGVPVDISGRISAAALRCLALVASAKKTLMAPTGG